MAKQIMYVAGGTVAKPCKSARPYLFRTHKDRVSRTKVLVLASAFISVLSFFVYICNRRSSDCKAHKLVRSLAVVYAITT